MSSEPLSGAAVRSYAPSGGGSVVVSFRVPLRSVPVSRAIRALFSVVRARHGESDTELNSLLHGSRQFVARQIMRGRFF